MNIYEDEQVEKKLNELTDELGTLVLDMLVVSLKKINHKNHRGNEGTVLTVAMRLTMPVGLMVVRIMRQCQQLS